MKKSVKAKRLAPRLGALIDGIDFARPLTERDSAALKAALLEHEVLFFRGQPLTPQRQVELARLFGAPETKHHPKFGIVDGQPEVAIVINDASRPPDIDVWHTDMTYLEMPPAATVLHCIECPSTGGDTLWASLSSALRALSPGLQAWLKGLRARHALRLDGIPMQVVRSLDENRIGTTHPVVRLHPESGRTCLFVNSVYTRSIEGLPEAESRHLLSLLFEVSQRPEHQVRFHWEPGSTAIWDNRCTQHYAIADYFPQRRVMHRVQVAGDALPAPA